MSLTRAPVPLREGMVVTIEPGLYREKVGGVRLESDVLVTKTGHKMLTSLSLDLDSSILR
jgi:Xaa-Pro aminopeptidase